MNHQQYVHSDKWKDRRDRYYHEHGGSKGYVCCVRTCSCRFMLELNHLTYAHSGQGMELDYELCWLCPEHHEMYHKGEVVVKAYFPRKFLFWKLPPRIVEYTDYSLALP